MKKIVMILVAVAQFAWASAQVAPADRLMKKMGLTAIQLAHYMAPGVNLGNTMEACNWNDVFTNQAGLKSETSWQNDKTTESYIRSLKQQGFNSLRIPTSWVAGHLTDKENMSIDPVWMKRIKEIVNYCLNAGLCVIINEHWDGGWMEHDAFTNGVNVAEHKEMFRRLWTNIAKEFKTYDQRVLFAALNEPGVGGASPQVQGNMLAPESKEFADRLLAYEQVFIDAVRATGGNNASRVLIVQAPKTEIDLAAKDSYDITRLKDKVKNRLMAEVHFYDPYQFTDLSEDKDWGKYYLYWGKNNKGGDADRTADAKYNEDYVEAQMKKMKTNFFDKGYPVLIGEFGANQRLAIGKDALHDASVKDYYKAVVTSAINNGCVPVAWDTNAGLPSMTIFNRASTTVSNANILESIQEAVKTAVWPVK